MQNEEKTLELTYVLLVCNRPSVFGLNRLQEDGTAAQLLDVDPTALFHTKMSSVEITKNAVVDLVSQVPHSRIHRRIDRDHVLYFDLTLGDMLEVASTYDSL